MGVCTRQDAGGPRVLVVDDDPEVVELTEIFLQRELDATTVGETDPEQALTRVDADRFDCVVSDYRMPSMTGVEFCRRASADSRVPCVVFTSADDPEIRQAVERAGFGLVYKRGTDGYDDLAETVRDRVETQLPA